ILQDWRQGGGGTNIRPVPSPQAEGQGWREGALWNLQRSLRSLDGVTGSPSHGDLPAFPPIAVRFWFPPSRSLRPVATLPGSCYAIPAVMARENHESVGKTDRWPRWHIQLGHPTPLSVRPG